MSKNGISSERHGQSIIITFDRPAAGNAMTLEMANELFNLMKVVTTDRSIRAVMFRGTAHNFMDGMDWLALGFDAPDITVGLDKLNQTIMPYHSVVRDLLVMDKPAIAVVEGSVAGPGFSLMLACDFIIAGRDTVFQCRAAEHALTPNGGCSYFLPRRVGLTKATEIMMLDEKFGAEEALTMKLINQVVDNESLQAEALLLLERLSEGPTRAYGGIKKLAAQGFENTINTHLGIEHTNHGGASRSFDFKLAVKAALKGQKAKFSGS